MLTDVTLRIEIPETHEATEFRPPMLGESYLGRDGSVEVAAFSHSCPHIILRPVQRRYCPYCPNAISLTLAKMCPVCQEEASRTEWCASGNSVTLPTVQPSAAPPATLLPKPWGKPAREYPENSCWRKADGTIFQVATDDEYHSEYGQKPTRIPVRKATPAVAGTVLGEIDRKDLNACEPWVPRDGERVKYIGVLDPSDDCSTGTATGRSGGANCWWVKWDDGTVKQAMLSNLSPAAFAPPAPPAPVIADILGRVHAGQAGVGPTAKVEPTDPAKLFNKQFRIWAVATMAELRAAVEALQNRVTAMESPANYANVSREKP